MPTDNVLIWSAFAATGVLYVLALFNKSSNLGIMSRMTEQVIIVLVPPLALIFLVLGTIMLGIATPTESGAMGAVGALVLAVIRDDYHDGWLPRALPRDPSNALRAWARTRGQAFADAAGSQGGAGCKSLAIQCGRGDAVSSGCGCLAARGR